MDVLAHGRSEQEQSFRSLPISVHLRVGPLVRSKLRKKYFLGVFEVVDHDFLGLKSVATSSCLLAAGLVIMSNQNQNYFFGVFRCGKNNADNFSSLSPSSCLQ